MKGPGFDPWSGSSSSVVMYGCEKSESESRSVLSDSLWPHGLYSPWKSLGQNPGVGSLSLLQGIFPTQGSNPGLLHSRQILYQLSHKESQRMWELDRKESSVLKNWCFWTVVLEKILENSLDCKESQPVHPKGNQSWIFIEWIDAEAEAPIFWPPDVKSWLIGKDHDAGKDWRQEEKGATEDEIVGWHHQLNGFEFEQAPGIGEGQGSLACCSPWGHKMSHTTEWLNNHNNKELDPHATTKGPTCCS